MKAGLVLVSLLAASLAAQQPSVPNVPPGATPGPKSPLPQKPPEKCMVEGRVVSAASGEPLKKAFVTLVRTASSAGHPRPPSTTTDENGHFLLNDVVPGNYSLAADRNGYVRLEYASGGVNLSYFGTGTILSLVPGQHVKDVLFRLVPAAVITGRVVDEDNEPLLGATVQALRYGYVRGQRQLVPEGEEQTNDLGEYRIHSMAPGRYYVSAVYGRGNFASVTTAASSTETEGYEAVFYPGTYDLTQAAPLEVRAGDDLHRIDFTMLPMRAVRVRGRVVSTLVGVSALNAQVMLVPKISMVRAFAPSHRTSPTDKNGSFEFRGVTPGTYAVIATLLENNKRLSAQQVVELGSGDVDAINLVITPGNDLAGTVRVEGNAAVDGRELRVILEPTEIMAFGP